MCKRYYPLYICGHVGVGDDIWGSRCNNHLSSQNPSQNPFSSQPPQSSPSQPSQPSLGCSLIGTSPVSLLCPPCNYHERRLRKERIQRANEENERRNREGVLLGLWRVWRAWGVLLEVMVWRDSLGIEGMEKMEKMVDMGECRGWNCIGPGLGYRGGDSREW
ncbi:Protein of unknown function [Pyronema omphalodes CBS 100304]|uniref:Uncharacterized protein n=1 Tax=Pyronema omphalodes (strain CBS 100304) TaxID=1076935 RepID=U4LE68_PYROM|nr:Protein of unknown function [Pyronema omphalodes CBS 100304]